MVEIASNRSAHPAVSSAWIVLIASATVLSSFALACATPFAALATVAGTRMTRRDALAATRLAWASNQAIGFGFLHYPWTASCIGWGIAIGLAALAATAAASFFAQSRFGLAATAIAFILACTAYEGGLFAATLILPTEYSAFSLAIVSRIVGINAAVTVALLAAFGIGRFLIARFTTRTTLAETGAALR